MTTTANTAVKEHLAQVITEAIDEEEWTQLIAAVNLGTTQNLLSRMRNNKVNGISIDYMLNIIYKLGFKMKLDKPTSCKLNITLM